VIATAINSNHDQHSHQNSVATQSSSDQTHINAVSRQAPPVVNTVIDTTINKVINTAMHQGNHQHSHQHKKIDIDPKCSNNRQLLTNNPHICTTVGPSDSSDDFSVTDAIRNSLTGAIRNTSFRVVVSSTVLMEEKSLRDKQRSFSHHHMHSHQDQHSHHLHNDQTPHNF
jgi:hypothetical protein